MVKVKYNDGTTKTYNNGDVVKLNNSRYIVAYDLKIGYKYRDLVVVDIEHYIEIKWDMPWSEICACLLLAYIPLILLLVL